MLNLGQSNKDTLAKLMATENITVIHKKVPTAYFDVKSRTLCIPMLKENMSQSLTDLFAGHEVGHALYTPVDGWHDSICEKGGLFKGYLNVVEDCRIEEKIKNKYPGINSLTVVMYQKHRSEISPLFVFNNKVIFFQERNNVI